MKYLHEQGIMIAVLEPCEKWHALADTLDCIANAAYEDCVGIVVPKECLPEDFFRLRTGLAGEILQKFSNYQMKIAVTGDFHEYASQSLKDFMYECNQGRQVFFKTTVSEGLAAIVRSSAE